MANIMRLGGGVGSKAPAIFGDGSDGVGLFTSNTTWNAPTEDTGMIVKNFESLTISDGVTVAAGNRNCGMIVRVKGDCTIAGSLVNKLSCKTILDSDGVDLAAVYPISMLSGKAGDGGNGGAGGDQSKYGAGAGGTGMSGRMYGGGWSAGGGGGRPYDHYDLYKGGAGGDANGITTAITSLFVSSKSSGYSASGYVVNGQYGGGGAGGYSQDGGSAGAAGGTSAGAAGGNVNSRNGAGGGAGNIGGGVIILLVGGDLTITGTIDCSGGAGGKGGNNTMSNQYGGRPGGGGGGAGGGRIFICHKGNISNTGTLNVNGGAGGAAGTRTYDSTSATAGTAGTVGTLAVKTYKQYMEEDVA